MGRVGGLKKVSMIERDAYAVKGNAESEKCMCLTFSLEVFFLLSIFPYFASSLRQRISVKVAVTIK